MRRAAIAIAAAIAVAFCVGITMQAQAQAPDTVILKGAPMGGVKLTHAAHSKLAGVKCDQCHHASKAEMPAKSATQKCTDCHTKAAAAPMKTKLQAAFHDPMAKKGLCIDCHLEQNKAGKKAPTKCNECHKKENV